MKMLGWFEIYVSDMKRAKAFYSAVFQTGEFLDLSNGAEQMLAFPSKEGSGMEGALVHTEHWSPGKGGTIIYIECEDCAIEEDRIIKNGGKIMKSKFSIGPFGFSAIFEDTEGNVLGLHSNI